MTQMRRHATSVQLASDTLLHFLKYSDSSLSYQTVERVDLMLRHALSVREANESLIDFLNQCLDDPEFRSAAAGGATAAMSFAQNAGVAEDAEIVDPSARLLPPAKRTYRKKVKQIRTFGASAKTRELRAALADYLLDTDEVKTADFRDFLDSIKMNFVRHDVHLLFSVLCKRGLIKRKDLGVYVTPNNDEKRVLMSYLTAGTPGAASWQDSMSA